MLENEIFTIFLKEILTLFCNVFPTEKSAGISNNGTNCAVLQVKHEILWSFLKN